MSFEFRDAERRLWLDGADAYRDLLHPDAIMVFPTDPPILNGTAILAAVDAGPRWIEVIFRNVREASSGSAHIFAYHAEATRDGRAIPYRAACLSAWTEETDGWRLLSHQQTPLPE